MIKLSILIPSVHTRRNTFLPKIQDEVYRQIDKLSDIEKRQVEVIVLSDNKTIMLGDKRNCMIEIAQGKYIQFVDDDDRISSNFVKTLLDATNTDSDVITFLAEVTINGGKPKICDYSIKHGKDYNTSKKYYRLPNHISCVKRELSLKSSFPSLSYAEDQAYAKLLLPHLKTEHKINEVLYYYDYNDNVSETQYQNMPEHIRKRRQQPPIVDIVFLSNAKTDKLKQMTQKAIDTSISGANQLPVNCIVIEQQPSIQYTNAKTVYHNAPFNYNQFMNLGARQGDASWVMFCNNDLIFHNGWLHNLLTANHPIVSPKCPNDPRQQGIKDNEIGNVCGRNLSGWAFMMTRELYDKVGSLPEMINFWFSDNATIKEVNRFGVKPMLVPSSLVTHLGSTTLKSLDGKTADDYTWGQCKIYNDHYGDNLFADNPSYKKYISKTTVHKKDMAIAISTRGRDVVQKSVDKWKQFYPNAEIIVVEDNGDVPNGIAKTKNKCIELLLETGLDHLFLADDDVYPVNSVGMYKYIQSPVKHMSLSFDRNHKRQRISHDVYIKKRSQGHDVYNSPCGLLLYCHRDVLLSGVRFDENFDLWGLEHKSFSLDIHSKGFTKYPFIDITNNIRNFYSYDYYGAIDGSVSESDRIKSIERNKEYFKTKHG